MKEFKYGLKEFRPVLRISKYFKSWNIVCNGTKASEYANNDIVTRVAIGCKDVSLCKHVLKYIVFDLFLLTQVC